MECPHCGERITIVLDLSVAGQAYIEDCFVCCRPISVSYTADGGELTGVTANTGD
ncbi:MAG: CPXCG motif-containing cysteine-rich protein [Gammaproteobacteria bacterium]